MKKTTYKKKKIVTKKKNPTRQQLAGSILSTIGSILPMALSFL